MSRKKKNRSRNFWEDIAKHCGVSVSTVSRVIHKSSPVSKGLNILNPSFAEIINDAQEEADRHGRIQLSVL
jgi:DNA-binding LacI/PurR family transcriptional regulator